ncbi:hypothetical protein [Nocardioides sp.]|uniref:hypothetical protein n=1 Tax=Nocardioides sp. TaxID=35761 RepID=UPI0035682581
MARSTAPSRARRRLIWSATLATVLVATAVALPSDVRRAGSLLAAYDAASAARAADESATRESGTEPHVEAPGTEPHRHDDPATKNAVSRAGETSEDAQDPTTAAEKRANTAYVAAQRRAADPKLKRVRVMPRRTKHPRTRYALANGCYTLTQGGDPLFFKPTDLGTYLLYTRAGTFVSTTGTSTEPGPKTVWTARKKGRKLTFTSEGTRLEQRGRSTFRPTRAQGCTAYPESQINVSGGPHAGVSPFQEVRGYIDAHTHGMAFEFLGGGAHCGKPWDTYGAPYALVDCPDHTYTGGRGAALEAFLSGEPSHDPVGWPTFVDWPAPHSLTHEGTYYRWLERSWRGGQRIFVNLLVENNQLCTLYPIKRNSCDDMDSVRLQAKDMYEMQDYIDAQFGGPGKGFYRIVTSPFEARRVINAGKMAVVMGIETSVPFGCTFKKAPGGDVPACDLASIDRQLDEVHDLGVRQMELVNKFDNALSGIAGDAGSTGVAVNSANFAETGTFWDMRHCEPEVPGAHDRTQYAQPDISPSQQDALFGAIGQLFGAGNLPAVPVYPRPAHCNDRGLTTLGEHTIKALAARHMLFDPDHMSVKARQSSLDTLEEIEYPGVLSSHSWSTPDAYPRIYKLGGFVAPYAGDSTGFVEKWRAHLGWADKRYYFGFGFGADINGLGAQGDPRGADVSNPVTYPFRGLNGVKIKKQHAGERVYDLNVDGVAQYGLYPDWVEDLAKVAGADGRAITQDMARGAEAYLQTWERAHGIAPDSCRNPDLRLPVDRAMKRVQRGMSPRAVMTKVGQPYLRHGRTFGFCARDRAGSKVMVTVHFTRAGTVQRVSRG